MTVVLDSRRDFSLETYRRVAGRARAGPAAPAARGFGSTCCVTPLTFSHLVNGARDVGAVLFAAPHITVV
jgi:hypothetical protein